MIANRLQAIVLLLLLVLTQWLGSVHDVSHVAGADHQACSQCLHGKPKQHAAAPQRIAGADPAVLSIPEARIDAVPQHVHRYKSPPRGPPLVT